MLHMFLQRVKVVIQDQEANINLHSCANMYIRREHAITTRAQSPDTLKQTIQGNVGREAKYKTLMILTSLLYVATVRARRRRRPEPVTRD